MFLDFVVGVERLKIILLSLTEATFIADTGRDLTWTQCEPCEKCYKQNLPLFDPQQASTDGNVPCNSSPCKALDTASCGTN